MTLSYAQRNLIAILVRSSPLWEPVTCFLVLLICQETVDVTSHTTLLRCHSLKPILDPLEPDVLRGREHGHMARPVRHQELQVVVRELGTRVGDRGGRDVVRDVGVVGALQHQQRAAHGLAPGVGHLRVRRDVPRVAPVGAHHVGADEQLQRLGDAAAHGLQQRGARLAQRRHPVAERERGEHGREPRADPRQHHLLRRVEHGRGRAACDAAQVTGPQFWLCREQLGHAPRYPAALAVPGRDELVREEGGECVTCCGEGVYYGLELAGAA